jgi:hypothetical protein
MRKDGTHMLALVPAQEAIAISLDGIDCGQQGWNNEKGTKSLLDLAQAKISQDTLCKEQQIQLLRRVTFQAIVGCGVFKLCETPATKPGPHNA